MLSNSRAFAVRTLQRLCNADEFLFAHAGVLLLVSDSIVACSAAYLLRLLLQLRRAGAKHIGRPHHCASVQIASPLHHLFKGVTRDALVLLHQRVKMERRTHTNRTKKRFKMPVGLAEHTGFVHTPGGAERLLRHAVSVVSPDHGIPAA